MFLDHLEGQAGLPIAVVGVGLGVIHALDYALLLRSVALGRFGTASAALSLAQTFAALRSVAVNGGIFALSEEHHISGLAASGLPFLEQEAKVFAQECLDLFTLGAVIAVVGACLLALSQMNRVL